MSWHILPGIVKIEIVRCTDLQPGVMLHSICGCVVAIAAPAEQIEFCGSALLKWEGSKLNGKRQEKTTLTFTTAHPLPEDERLAFVVTSAAGKQYLIGSREGRFPVIEYSDTTGEVGRSVAARTYKITHVAQKSVLECVL